MCATTVRLHVMQIYRNKRQSSQGAKPAAIAALRPSIATNSPQFPVRPPWSLCGYGVFKTFRNCNRVTTVPKHVCPDIDFRIIAPVWPPPSPDSAPVGRLRRQKLLSRPGDGTFPSTLLWLHFSCTTDKLATNITVHLLGIKLQLQAKVLYSQCSGFVLPSMQTSYIRFKTKDNSKNDLSRSLDAALSNTI